MFDGTPTDPWPFALLVLRIAAVGLLYLFLVTAFRALRADLRASSAPERPRAGERGRAPVPVTAGGRTADGRTIEAYPSAADEEWEDDWEDEWEPHQAPLPLDRDRPSEARRGFRRPRIWLPVTAAVLVAAFGGTAMILADTDPGTPPANNQAGQQEQSNDPFEPPTIAPDPGRVTVGLAATEDAQVRVTVDGVVEFDGTLPRGERQAWDGEYIQVWTDSGKTLQLAVNGEDLGAYSPAMGHPDWNRIDYAFWPGWGQ